MNEKGKGRVFYGWWVLLSLFVFMAVSIGLVVNSFSLFFKPVTSSLGFSMGAYSLTTSISAIMAMFGCIIIGKIINTVDIRILISVSTVIFCGCIILLAFCRTLTQFYVVSAVLGLGYAGIGGVGVSQIVTNWFNEKQGLAMALAMTGSAIGGIIFSPVLNGLILSVGWQNAFWILGVIVAVVTLPFSIFVIRLRPQDKGMTAYGTKTEEQNANVQSSGFTLGEAAKMPYFWGLCFANFFAGLLVMAVQMHIAPFLESTGFTSSFAATVMVITNAVLILGKLAFGGVNDRFGSKASVHYIFGVYVLTLVSLYFTKTYALAVVFAVLFGFAAAITTVALPLWAAATMGSKDYAMIFAIMSMFMTVGAAIGTPLTGFIYDSAKKYDAAWLLLIGVAVVGWVISIVSVAAGKKGLQAKNASVAFVKS